MNEFQLKYGCNPNQKPSRIFMADGSELPVEILNGRPGYINFLDAFNGYQLVKELKEATGLPAATSFKHVSPAGAAVGLPLSEVEKKIYWVDENIGELSPLACAYARARGADRMSSFGDFISLSDVCDVATAKLIQHEVSDGIIAPGYEPEAFEILKAKKKGNYNVIKIDPEYKPAPIERKQVYGVTFEQGRNEFKINEELLNNVVTENKEIPQEIINGKESPHLYMEVPELYIYDTMNGWVRVKKVIKNYNVNNWMKVRLDNKVNIYCTTDHPFVVVEKGRTYGRDLKIGDKVYYNNEEDKNKKANITKVEIEKISMMTGISMDSYDVETESDHFEVNGMYSHNCRSFLSPWKDENGNYKWEGRFNMGVVSINLPQIGIIANGDEKVFWRLLDERLELCKKALICRYKNLLDTPSDISPIHWQYGAIARLKPGEKINKLLQNFYK